MSVRPCLAAAVLLASLLGLASCKPPAPTTVAPLDEPISLTGGVAAPRVNGVVGTIEPGGVARASYGSGAIAQPHPLVVGNEGGDVSLDFADTDLREVTAQILGSLLHVNYTIDPSVHGTATLKTTTPIARSQLLPTLEALLAQNGATLLQEGALYRVVPTSNVGAALAGSAATGGSVVVPLRYASADDLARVLQPYAGQGARVIADAGRNVLLVSGEPTGREALLNLIAAFDIDILAGESYALLPATSGDAKDFSQALQTALRAQSGGALAGQVRVVPMERLNAVLVIAGSRRYIDDAERIYELVDKARRDTVRSWHVYYLQNGSADDVAYVLQEAFTPNAVTAPPPSTGQNGNGNGNGQRGNGLGSGIGGGLGSGLGGGGLSSGQNGGGLGGGGINSGGIGAGLGAGLGGGAGGLSESFGGGQGGAGLGTAGQSGAPTAPAGANPLLGGLDASGGQGADANAMRIIPNPQNHALLIYGTRHEEDTIEAMLNKIDLQPLQVRIDATIAEVTLNDQLQYGTQFFFKSGGINGVLNTATATVGAAGITSVPLGTSFPGFVIGGTGASGAPIAISALQAVTKVQVLSSPQILVLDNQPARLQVGSLVPYLSASSQSTISANAPIVNSVNYQPTGVIMEVTPRVNPGGLVTLDLNQEVSDVSSTTTGAIDSPTFEERSVSSRIVVQDGQTVGLAGLIQDSVSRGNSGIPWLKDIPLLGFFAGSQSNTRGRTELLVLITPHVVHDQRDARALTEDLRQGLSEAARVPAALGRLGASGSEDPNRRIRQKLDLEP